MAEEYSNWLRSSLRTLGALDHADDRIAVVVVPLAAQPEWVGGEMAEGREQEEADAGDRGQMPRIRVGPQRSGRDVSSPISGAPHRAHPDQSRRRMLAA